MQWGEGWYEHMRSFKRTKLALSYEPANFLPFQGEYRGGPTRGVLLSGRRGGLFNFSPFDSKTNFNMVVAGESGSGKSVLMQALMCSTLSRSGRVFILDVGRSFERVCHNLAPDSEHITFAGSGICINPFSTMHVNAENFENIDAYLEYIDDMMSLMKSIVSSMAAPTKGLDDLRASLLASNSRSATDFYKLMNS